MNSWRLKRMRSERICRTSRCCGVAPRTGSHERPAATATLGAISYGAKLEEMFGPHRLLCGPDSEGRSARPYPSGTAGSLLPIYQSHKRQGAIGLTIPQTLILQADHVIE